ncbi:MAG TPA: DUF4349 domain-containing protein [Candidatus Limnocylindria bacterium]|nr:DUF4349 domain-containing protein [Candidatus Limnocylindria bacterium]
MAKTDARVAPRRALQAAGAALILFLLAACSAGAAPADPQFAAVQPGAARGDAAAGAPAEDKAASGSGTTPGAAEVSVQRQIVKTGEITIRVPNVANALASVRATAMQLGGYVGGSQAGTLEDSATLTLRIPAARFDDALAALHELDGKVVVEATREEDVTASIVDLTARIDNLEASESQYRALLARAEKIDDVLSVQSRLDDIRGQIEQLKGQLKSVSGQADLATLTVTLSPDAQPVQQASSGWDPGATASQALAALVEIGQGLASVAIWFAIVWLPILLVLALIGLVVLRGLLEVRRRMPAAPGSDAPMG